MSGMYLNNDFNNSRKLNSIKHPEDKKYRGNIFLYQTQEEFESERTIKSNLDAAVKAAGLSNFLKFQNFNLRNSKIEIKHSNPDIENLDARLYKVDMGEFVDIRNEAEVTEVDLTDSDLLKIRTKNTEIKNESENTENTENTTRVETADTRVETAGDSGIRG